MIVDLSRSSRNNFQETDDGQFCSPLSFTGRDGRTSMYVCVCAYSRCEVVTTKRRIERGKSLKQEVPSLTSSALLKQNESLNCNGRRGSERAREREREEKKEEKKERLTFCKVASVETERRRAARAVNRSVLSSIDKTRRQSMIIYPGLEDWFIEKKNAILQTISSHQSSANDNDDDKRGKDINVNSKTKVK